MGVRPRPSGNNRPPGSDVPLSRQCHATPRCGRSRVTRSISEPVGAKQTEARSMNSIIWIIGLIVVVLAILSYLGLR